MCIDRVNHFQYPSPAIGKHCGSRQAMTPIMPSFCWKSALQNLAKNYFAHAGAIIDDVKPYFIVRIAAEHKGNFRQSAVSVHDA